MGTCAWFHGYCVNSQDLFGDVLEKLTCLGLKIDAWPEFQEREPGIVGFDHYSSGLLDFIQTAVRQHFSRVLALAHSDSFSSDQAWQLLQAGASDVLISKAHDTDCRAIAARLERWSQVDAILYSERIAGTLIGQSEAWLSNLRQVVEAALFSDAPILLMGESGTGKELVARLVHELDQRTDKEGFVLIDCSTIVPELSGSEFFGHERGAFTGALYQRDGAFSLAHGGTLFLDEVGELPLNLQAQLLRVIQEGTYKRVGGNTWYRTGFRLVCATNRDLEQQVEAGRFRPDLYYRIASIVNRLPPLRDRPSDILPLARYFMGHAQHREEQPELDDVIREYLLKRSYPGNVRDLRQVVARIMNRYVGAGPVTAGCIPREERPADGCADHHWNSEAFDRCIGYAVELGLGLREIGRTAEDVALQFVVNQENGNLQRAARRLGVTDRTLQLRRAAQRDKTLPAP